YPIVVENALAEHPAVREAAVVGVPHPEWGEAIVAAVSLFPGREASSEELIAHCRQRVSKFAVPKHIEIVPSLPRGSTDKLNKREVQRLLVESGKLPWNTRRDDRESHGIGADIPGADHQSGSTVLNRGAVHGPPWVEATRQYREEKIRAPAPAPL